MRLSAALARRTVIACGSRCTHSVGPLCDNRGSSEHQACGQVPDQGA
jgi:hypothetical protein